MDQHPAHTARTTGTLVRQLGVELIWLPHRSPELNPMDTLWGKAKDALAANRQFEDIDDQTDEFVRQLMDVPPNKMLRLSGLRSRLFWLWKS